MIQTASIIIWILFSTLSGYLEAFYWSGVAKKRYKKYKYAHEIFTVVRAIIAAPLVYWVYLYSNWTAIFIGAAFVAMFPFFHDGMYYLQRWKLDKVYPRKWKDTSTTSTAKLTANYEMRLFLLLFICPILIMINLL